MTTDRRHRIRLSPISFHDEPSRDYVLTMHILLAGATGVAAAEYLHTSWWSIAIGVGLLGLLELSLRSRVTAWFAIAIGTAFSAAVGGVGGMALATAFTETRAAWWVVGAVGGVVTAWLALDAHRKLRAASRQHADRADGSPGA